MTRDPDPVAHHREIESIERDFARAQSLADEYEAAIHAGGLWAGWLDKGASLREARAIYLALGSNSLLAASSRASAIMNAANTLMAVGRYFDALDLYERANQIRPNDGMVRGNRGMTLAELAPHLRGSHRLVVGRALDDLRFAVSAEHLDDGSPGHAHSRDVFAAWLDRLSHHAHEDLPLPETREYEDPYAAWAVEANLLLSPALGSMPPEDDLDPVHISGLVTPLAAFTADFPVPAEFSAVNAIKRDYLTARFLAYLAVEEPPEVRLSARSRSAHYVETLDYARWDLTAGLAANAYAMAVNLADKLATFIAMWLGLPSDRVNDRNWPFDVSKRRSSGGSTRPHKVLAELMSANEGQLIFILGLVDLAQEEAESAARAARREVRDAAVHRFLTVRHWGPNGRTALITPVEKRTPRDRPPCRAWPRPADVPPDVDRGSTKGSIGC